MKLKLLLTAFWMFTSLAVFAEGEQGMGLFFGLAYIFFILLYTVAGGLILKLIARLFVKNDSTSIWFYYGIGFIVTLLIALIMGEYFVWNSLSLF